ncbi:dentin sialophosphoprotein-like isoform X1 [Penaeus japonicus]|uniref:dentin sialophosphoprotein-like isoform X1 n=1 Tax=Penaeus japonicus TaxID=27405 RepID=UPI001C70E077|nr:dentin sialophosphoprotein-like isoform X1 [Penaeus japonicus]
MRTSGKLSELSGCSIKYLERRAYHSARSDWGPHVASAAFLSRRLNSSRNLYRKDLYAHYGCVNAIEFSKEGDLLVSGGDDRRVLLWNVDSALSGTRRPRAMESEHSSNIFCLSFDSSNSKIFSAGNDEQVIVHDLRTGETTDVFLHREAVYGVSVNPTLDSVFASAGEDGQVLLYDMRESAATDPVCLARYHDAFHAVQFHPVEPVFVVTANSREGVSLWDVRKPRVPVLRYGEKRCAQSSMCARFNRTGNQIIALRRRLPPVLYNTHSSKPVCQFDAEHYYNSCTMKSCCFAGDNDQFVLSGSDDFNLYMWKIPENNSSEHFVSEAHMVLKGHRSIVNQVRFNPQNFIIASSGVEKIVKLWSGLSLPGSKGSLKTKASGSFMTRRVYTHEEYIGLVMESGQDVNHDYSHGCTDEDPRMMAFFDSLVQREVEGWTSNTDLSDDIDNEPQTSGHDDDDTETTTTQSSLSVVTSQSDDNDSEASMNGHDSFNISTRQRLDSSLSRRQTQNDQHKDDDDNDNEEEEEEEDNKVSGGSEWIMRLIAKKRAILRAAKKAQRNRKHLKKHRKKAQQYLRSFTSSRRHISLPRYLYHPEGQSSLEGNSGRSESAGLSSAMEGSAGRLRRRSSYRRRYMAPYTIMVTQNTVPDSDPDSDDQEDGDDDRVGSETDEEIETIEQNFSEGDSGKRLVWSSDSDSSSDEDLPRTKRKRKDCIDSDSEDDDALETKNGDVIRVSEIVDSNSSDSDVERSITDIALENSDRNLSTEGTSSRVTCLPDILSDTSLSETALGINSNGVSDIGTDLNISSAVSDAIPISSITTDDNGSLLFDTDHNSLVSGLDLPGSLDLVASAASTRKAVQNGTSQTSNGATCVNTSDNGISVLPSSTEKSEDDCGNKKNHDNRNGVTETENGNGDGEQTLTFKKRMPTNNIRNYRRHNEEDL